MSQMKAFNFLNRRRIAIQHLNLFVTVKSAQKRAIYIFYCTKIFQGMYTKYVSWKFVVMHYVLTSSHRRPYKPKINFGTANRWVSKRANVCVFWQKPCQHATHGVPSWRLTCIHAIVSRSPWGHGSVAPDKRHCKQWTSSLFCGFLPNPFIQDLFFWHISQEFVKTDWYPWSLTSLQYAVCSTGCWSIIGIFDWFLLSFWPPSTIQVNAFTSKKWLTHFDM